MYDGSEFILPDDAKLPIIDWAGNFFYFNFIDFWILLIFFFFRFWLVNQVETSDGWAENNLKKQFIILNRQNRQHKTHTPTKN